MKKYPAARPSRILPFGVSAAETPKKSANPQVRITTNMGVIEAELYADKAPLTVKNVLSYVERGYYNGTIFHRVMSGLHDSGRRLRARSGSRNPRACRSRTKPTTA